LQTAQLKTMVDIRELPLSRKKGFSKIRWEQSARKP